LPYLLPIKQFADFHGFPAFPELGIFLTVLSVIFSLILLASGGRHNEQIGKRIRPQVVVFGLLHLTATKSGS
jgi:hypothetical protein